MSEAPPAAPSNQDISQIAHAAECDELLARLGVSSNQGLTDAEADERLNRYGQNRLPEPEKDPAWRRFLAQFADPLVLTLVVAAVIAVVVGLSGAEGGSFMSRYADAIAIMLIGSAGVRKSVVAQETAWRPIVTSNGPES